MCSSVINLLKMAKAGISSGAIVSFLAAKLKFYTGECGGGADWTGFNTFVGDENEAIVVALVDLTKRLQKSLNYGELWNSVEVPLVYEEFKLVCNSIFVSGCDQNITFGRLIALFEYASILSIKCHADPSLEERIPVIAQWLEDFIVAQVDEWVEQNGGWSQLVQISGNLKRVQRRRNVGLFAICAAATIGIGQVL